MTNLTISSTVESTGGKIDFSSYVGSLTLMGDATLDADNYSDQDGYAIDLSGVSSLTFVGSRITLDVYALGAADSNNILFPTGFKISGSAPTITPGADVVYAEHHGDYIIPAETTAISYPARALGHVTAAGTSLTISEDITSVSGNIDLSGLSSLTCVNSPLLTGYTSVTLPSSANIHGDCRVHTTVYQISSTPVTMPITTDSHVVILNTLPSLTISNTITSQRGQIDFSSYTNCEK